MARAAVLGRLSWRVATVTAVVPETARAATLVLDVPGWPGHRPGQHVDVRLTAADGYQAQRSYSIASAPGDPALAITVDRIDDGELSPWLTSVARAGDRFELRGPIGGWFVWDGSEPDPVLLVAGGSGVVPLMAMVRHRARQAIGTRMRLLYSARSADDVLFRVQLDRLAERHDGFDPVLTFTRRAPDGWTGYRRRIDGAMLAEVSWTERLTSPAFVCGPTALVETVATSLVALGYPPGRVKTERFGATGAG